MKTIKMIRHTDSLMEIVGEDHGYHPIDVKLYVLASEAEAEIEALRDVNGEMDSMYQDRLLDMEAKVADSAERERVLVEALEEAIGAGEYVIRLCENDLACGASPNPMVKSMPHATLAECYAAMRFLTKARAPTIRREPSTLC